MPKETVHVNLCLDQVFRTNLADALLEFDDGKSEVFSSPSFLYEFLSFGVHRLQTRITVADVWSVAGLQEV